MSVKEWLEANKVFFETAAASLLSAMALIVAIAQAWIAKRQTSLLRLQTHVAEAQALPQFEVSIHQQLSQTTQKFDDSFLVVFNRGGPVHDFSAGFASFLVVTAPGPTDKPRSVEVPVSGYFFASVVNNVSIGELVKMSGNKNNAHVANLSRAIDQVARDRKWSFGTVEERFIVRLSYRDLLNRKHEDYYLVRFVSGGTRITDEEGSSAFKKWHGGPPVELTQLTPDMLLNLVTSARDSS